MGEPGCQIPVPDKKHTHLELPKKPALVQRRDQRPVKPRVHVPTTGRYADFGLLMRPLVQRTPSKTPTSNASEQPGTNRNKPSKNG
jgi:hypothetical protein